MGGFTSINNFLSGATNYWRSDWNKSYAAPSVGVANEWKCLFRSATGSTGPDTVMDTGPNLTFQPLSGMTAGIIPIGPAVDSGWTGYKQIVHASAFSVGALSAPCVLMLVDCLGFYRFTGVTVTGDQNTNHNLPLPRYADGKGVQAFAYNSRVTALGAGTPSLSITYSGATGIPASTPLVLPVCKTAATCGHIMYSGAPAAGKYGPFIPLADNAGGILRINKISISSTYTSGEFAVVLCKPILTLPIVAPGMVTEKDFMNQIPSMPKIYDGACLTWLIYDSGVTPAGAQFYGHLDFVW